MNAMKRKWIVILAALVVVAIALGVAFRSRGPAVTLEHLGKNQFGTPLFVLKNHSGRPYSCSGLEVRSKPGLPRDPRGSIYVMPVGLLAPHSSIQLPLNPPFDPEVHDVSVVCTTDEGFITKVRHWARGAGLHWPAMLSRFKPPEDARMVVRANVSKPPSASATPAPAIDSRQ